MLGVHPGLMHMRSVQAPWPFLQPIATAPVSNVATTSVTTAGNLLSYDGSDQPTVTLYYDADDAVSTDVPRAFGSLKLWLDANDTANMDTGYAAAVPNHPTMD